MSNLPNQPSASTIARNPHLYGTPLIETAKSVMERQQDNRIYREPVKPRIRQSSKPLMNGLEKRFLSERLSKMYKDERIVAQGMRVKIAGSAWYKVDFFIPIAGHCHEVKGPKVMQNQQSRQILALKVAASTFPEYQWWLHWLDDDEWQQQLVKP